MTGAAMPDGADAVAMQEHVQADGEILVAPGAARASHIRHPGKTSRQAPRSLAMDAS